MAPHSEAAPSSGARATRPALLLVTSPTTEGSLLECGVHNRTQRGFVKCRKSLLGSLQVSGRGAVPGPEMMDISEEMAINERGPGTSRRDRSDPADAG
jgi:hypothetical protein